MLVLAQCSRASIDGITQIEKLYTSVKRTSAQGVPATPDFDKEILDTIKYEGLPPLEPVKADLDVVVFWNVGELFLKDEATRSVSQVFTSATADGIVVVEKGRIVCSGECLEDLSRSDAVSRADSSPPVLFPMGVPLVSPTSPANVCPRISHSDELLIPMKASTNDGPVFDPLSNAVPEIIEGKLIKAADGLLFATRDALLGYRSGVTSAVTAPSSYGSLAGLSTVFSTVAAHKLVEGAVIQEVAALHFRLTLNSGISVSTQIATLRAVLLGEGQGDVAQRFADVVAGKIPLVVEVESADVIASLLVLKKEVEAAKGHTVRLTLAGATEAHLLAKKIGQAGVGVIVKQRPFPAAWEQKRVLPGPPLTQSSAIAALVAHGVTVGIEVDSAADVRNTRFDVAWAALESNGVLGKADALALASSNLEDLLGVEEVNGDLVATKGGPDFEGKVVAIISPRLESVNIVF
ncbi:hypothetical protein B0H11DRAFT_1898948 [Mycena galericulata]|nr:hypothetical protein B0H11DRAFT_1898948 [Mycena galericulata]